jgi:hypothetical protein
MVREHDISVFLGKVLKAVAIDGYPAPAVYDRYYPVKKCIPGCGVILFYITEFKYIVEIVRQEKKAAEYHQRNPFHIKFLLPEGIIQ